VSAAELTRRGVALEGEAGSDAVRFIFTVPQTTFGVTVRFVDYKDRQGG
jgi:hypothetical protein